MKHKALLIANYSVKAEAFVRYWPEGKWDLHLYTYKKNEWFPGMSERFDGKWIAHIPKNTDHRYVGDRSTKKKRKLNNRFVSFTTRSDGVRLVMASTKTLVMRIYVQFRVNTSIIVICVSPATLRND